MIYDWNIIGHKMQVQGLEQDLKINNINHAYLFSGPDSLGKFKIAKTFSKILQCSHNFCRNCQNCQLIESENHLDTLFFRDQEEIISIQDIRKLKELVNLKFNSRYRIIVMENIDRMTIAAQNAFLKMLEEPPPKTIFLLTTKNISNILQTIISRCRIYNFYPLPNSLIEKYLNENIEKDSMKIENIIALSQGKIGQSILLANNFKKYENKLLLLQIIQNFLNKNDLYIRFQYIEKLVKEPTAIIEFLETFLFVLRNHLHKSIYNVCRIIYIKSLSLCTKKYVYNYLLIFYSRKTSHTF